MRCLVVPRQLWQAFRQRLGSFQRADRGDVPGWVMVTVMTAILVVAITAVFKGAIVSAVQQAINSVQGSTP